MKRDSVPSSAPAEETHEIIRRSPPCRRGFPTHPFERDGWPGRAAPRSPGQPPTRADDEGDSSKQHSPLRIPHKELDAQSLACAHLVRACRQAIDDLNIESGHDSATNERAVAILREIQSDWSTALKALRRFSNR